jgi:hypothetical protein
MLRITHKESPVFNVTKQEIVDTYSKVYMCILDMRGKNPNSSKPKMRLAFAEPGWAASEIIYMALYGYTKKSKFVKARSYIRWNNAPKTLYKRAVSLMGLSAKHFFDGNRGQKFSLEDLTFSGSKEIDNTVDKMVSGAGQRKPNTAPDPAEIQRRMMTYIEDFDLHSSVDRDILSNLIKTQILIEQAHATLLNGGITTLDLKGLAEQQKNYTMLLGLSKKDRLSFGADRKKGSIAELSAIYEETLDEYPELEQEFLIEELNLLLDKFERQTPDGDREISVKTFRVVSGGFTIEEALEITGRKRRNASKPKEDSSNS